jgi:hypothetical protein
METFPFTVTGGQFWGDDVVVAGTDVSRNDPTCQVKVLKFSHTHGGDYDYPSREDRDSSKNMPQSIVQGEASLIGSCSAMELCGMPR